MRLAFQSEQICELQLLLFICRKKNFLNKYNKWKINEKGDKVYITESIQPGHTHSNSGTE
jgi:hypothetical protein